MAKPNGYILWEGPSALDGAPVAVIATMGTRNEKTGDMIQTWIMRADCSPVDAVKSGADCSVCGDCPHRGQGNGKGRSCYVTVFQAPLAVWKSYKRGAYPRFYWRIHGAEFAGRMVRLGAYGDPMAAPVELWRAVTRRADGWTGYTHQWGNTAIAHGQEFSSYIMASCDSQELADKAQAMGWRTFRTMLAEEQPNTSLERLCPSEANGRTCANCRRCNGQAGKRPGASIAIHVHGAGSRNYATNCRA